MMLLLQKRHQIICLQVDDNLLSSTFQTPIKTKPGLLGHTGIRGVTGHDCAPGFETRILFLPQLCYATYMPCKARFLICSFVFMNDPLHYHFV